MNIKVKLVGGETNTFRDLDNGRFGSHAIRTVHRFDFDDDVLTVSAYDFFPATGQEGEPVVVGHYKPKTWLVARAVLPDE